MCSETAAATCGHTPTSQTNSPAPANVALRCLPCVFGWRRDVGSQGSLVGLQALVVSLTDGDWQADVFLGGGIAVLWVRLTGPQVRAIGSPNL